MSEQKNKWFNKNINKEVGDAVVRINIVLPNRTGAVKRDYRVDVEIEYESLEEQMIEMPSLFAFWSSLLSEQRAVVSKIERIITAKRAKVASKLIEKMPDIARWKLEEIIESDDEVQALGSKFIVSKRNESKLFDVVNALKMKADMVRSLAGFKRQEYQDAK